jgi:hypothetical protein
VLHDRARLGVAGRDHDVCGDHVLEPAQHDALVVDAVLQADHGGRRRRRGGHCPHGLLGVLALGGQQDDVAPAKLDRLDAAGGDRDAHHLGPVRSMQAQAVTPQRLGVLAARHEQHVHPGPGQQAARQAADRSRPDDDEPCHRSSVTARSAK